MKLDPHTTDLGAHIGLLAAFENGDYGQIAAAAEGLSRSTTVGTMQEVLRLLHLFYGFPKLVRAWNALPEHLRPGSDESSPSGDQDADEMGGRNGNGNGNGNGNENGDADGGDDGNGDGETSLRKDLGEATFRQLYGPQTDRVLKHLRLQDPLTADWILNHAYGTVLSRPQLHLAIKERLAILALASTGCWRQWQSHVDNAKRLGVSEQTLTGDLLATAWPAESAKAQALDRLR